MKMAFASGLIALSVICSQGGESFVHLKAVPFNQVEIKDAFWSPRRETNRLVSIPHNIKMLQDAGNIKNFELAAAGARTGYSGPVFMDSDLYKGMEAAAYSLATQPDPELDKTLDGIIAKIAAAQMPNGYLNTHFQVNDPDHKWTNLRDWHELYCAGHLFEAAVAHFQATGKRSLLNVAIKLADHIDSVFGEAPGKRLGYPGHPEIELALVKLARATGEQRYFELAKFFVMNRGKKFFATEHNTPLNEYDGSYWQDDMPIFDHRNIKGHAVRAAYLLSGTVDVASETGDERLLKMVRRVWRNTTEKQMYVTGGIGPSASNEGFTEDYDLPNLTAYQETCASVAMALWNHRLALLYGDARYADMVERSLYNGVLAGMARDGTKYFYVNPLASSGNHHRSGWFGCACCPPNVARTLASLGGYVYATSDDSLWVNLYVQGTARTQIKGTEVKLAVETDYPWDGRITLRPTLAQPTAFELRLRIPSWCADARLTVNGRDVKSLVTDKGYAVVSRTWKSGDTVKLNLDMPVRRVAAHPGVKEDTGALAIQRGPLVYCLEECDNGEHLSEIALPAQAELKARKDASLLGGVVVITGEGFITPELDWNHKLYQAQAGRQTLPIKAIPYYAWDNRQAGAMKVWMPEVPPVHAVGGLEQRAKVTMSFKNSNCQPQGINDGIVPKKSGDQPAAVCHWWPHKGSTEWVQYSFKKPVTISGSSVFWFDDTGHGSCRLPESWNLQYLEGNTWKTVNGVSAYPAELDQWARITFDPVTATAFRIEVKLKPDWAGGIHEWTLSTPEDE